MGFRAVTRSQGVLDIGLGAVAVSVLCQGLRFAWVVLMHHGRVFSTLAIHGEDGEGGDLENCEKQVQLIAANRLCDVIKGGVILTEADRVSQLASQRRLGG